MRRRIACLFLALLYGLAGCCAEEATDLSAPADAAAYPPAEYEFTGRWQSASYESDTLVYTIERFTIDNIQCILTKVWVQDPARQIRKANAEWGKGLASPADLIKKVPGTVLAINASGYISRVYPDIPESYPGQPSDYFFTTLGSLVITDGTMLRELEGVPFYGLALSENGIDLYRGADNALVLATEPVQTWAFFENCAMQVNGEDLLPEEGTWIMALERHPRTVIARVNRNNYLILHVPYREDSSGMSLYRLNTFFSAHFETEWVYNLDGGHSSTLYCKRQKKDARLTRLVPNRQPVADILCFTE